MTIYKNINLEQALEMKRNQSHVPEYPVVSGHSILCQCGFCIHPVIGKIDATLDILDSLKTLSNRLCGLGLLEASLQVEMARISLYSVVMTGVE